ncbi:glycine betaine/L-proline ABC transporter substrate-binding protein ProX [Aerosakkonema funiforme]|uniref:Glycine betaine/L-proline ABC transporter substrate-binding protein ProX n=2 Tax=Oscillatoriophycideae TaxID=1301283 RepID=A0A926ZKN7_9CYAN|nr:glycine betaine/L-proline ABC transporter substrate-binding protein ProX [Aerosakkonema funiforme]MBD2185572.1 glycine betaine/L-proline ABC transporter substrate-binding protein ProX [Aerosakkonema funiforme FACHB-1375]
MKGQTKTLTLATVTALVVGLIACQPTPNATTVSGSTESQKAMPGKGVRVRPGFDIPPFRLIAEVVDIGLEKLGYEVPELKQISSAALVYAALASDDIDFTPTHSEKSYAKFYQNSGGDAKLEQLGKISDNFLQGYQIDKKTADQYKITNLGQLKDPKIAKLFDSDGDGKADLSGAQAGWGADEIINHHLDVYGLRATVEHNQGDIASLIVDVIARYRQGKPVLLYNFIPSWQSQQDLKPNKDVIWLEVPFTSMPKSLGVYTEKDTSVDGKNIGFPKEGLRVVATKKFLAANPAAKRWFELVQIPLEDINAEMWLFHEGKRSPEQIRQRAEEWVKKNQKLFDSWLEEARKAGKNSG